VDGKVIVLGGQDDTGKVLNSCESYDLVHKKRQKSHSWWCPFPPMLIERCDACAAVVDGHMIVMGGWDARNRALDSCEMYDPDQKRWCSVPSMPTKRSGACAVAVDGKVIVLGGQDDTGKVLNSCESYDLVHKKWCPFPSMIMSRSRACAALVDGKKVIVMGGEDNKGPNGYRQHLSSCEVYRPGQQ